MGAVSLGSVNNLSTAVASATNNATAPNCITVAAERAAIDAIGATSSHAAWNPAQALKGSSPVRGVLA